MLTCHGQGHELVQGTPWYPGTGCKHEPWREYSIISSTAGVGSSRECSRLLKINPEKKEKTHPPEGFVSFDLAVLHLRHIHLGSQQKNSAIPVWPSTAPSGTGPCFCPPAKNLYFSCQSWSLCAVFPQHAASEFLRSSRGPPRNAVRYVHWDRAKKKNPTTPKQLCLGTDLWIHVSHALPITSCYLQFLRSFTLPNHKNKHES